MGEYRRPHYNLMLSRLSERRKCIFVLAGPRQVGKSTVMAQIAEPIDKVVFLFNADSVNEEDSDWIRRSWESVRSRMDIQHLQEAVLVIDEIQKIRRWSEYVKREWDAVTLNHVNLKVVLLGSSRLLLRKGLTESLAGRFELIRMGHWTFPEMKAAFGLSLQQWIYFGEPDVILMDEPCASLDPIATAKIEDLMRELAAEYTIVIVTHNMQQAVRISDNTAFFLLGELVEYGETEKLFSQPQDKRTEDYITGRVC